MLYGVLQETYTYIMRRNRILRDSSDIVDSEFRDKDAS